MKRKQSDIYNWPGFGTNEILLSNITSEMPRKSNNSSVPFGRKISPTKAIVFVACCVLYLQATSYFVYQWQLIRENREDDSQDDETYDDSPSEVVDVYSSLQSTGIPLVATRFKVQEPLGSGFVSHAFSGIDVNTNESVVLKFTYVNVTESLSPTPLKGIPDSVLRLKALQQEYMVYQSMKDTRLLQSHFYGDYNSFRVLVTQKGGKSLIQHQEIHKEWSKADIHQIAYDIILDLEQLHDKSFIHNDMHTGNIAFKKINENMSQVNLIDFNSCKRYRSPTTFKHFQQKHNYFRVPLHRFSPPCFYKEKHCSRRDDLFSLGYMLVMLASEYANCSPLYSFSCPQVPHGFWFSPPLPWAKVSGKQNLIDFMTGISFNILNAPNNYRHELPSNFRQYFEHLESLEFESKPDYGHLASLFPLSPVR